MKGLIRIKHDTILKVNSADSSTLDDHLKFDCPAGTDIEIAAYLVKENHIKFTIAKREDDIKGRNTWYCYLPHCEVEFDGRTIYPEVPLVSKDNGRSYTLAGGLVVGSNQSIIPNGNFTWAEATHNFTRMPESKDIVEGIIRIANLAQKVRDQYGPVYVNSWYRPPAINRRVGGAANSRHLYGDALDIRIPGMRGRQIYDALNPWWPGGLGMYRSIPNMAHIDARGYKARWGR